MGMASPNELRQRQLTLRRLPARALGRRRSRCREAPDEGEGVRAAGRRPRERCLPGARGQRRARPSRAISTSSASPRACATASACCARANRPPSSRWARTACSPPASSCWCSSTGSGARRGQPRAAERKRAAPTSAQVCNDIGAIHYYIGGTGFRQPGEQKELTQKQRDQIATFGRVSTRDEDDYSVVHGFLRRALADRGRERAGPAAWCARPDDPGKRYAHGQLIGGAAGRREDLHARPGALADGRRDRRPARRREAARRRARRRRGAARPASTCRARNTCRRCR